MQFCSTCKSSKKVTINSISIYYRAHVSPQTLLSNQHLDSIFKNVRLFLERRPYLPQNEFTCASHEEVWLLSSSQNERNLFIPGV